MGGGKVGKVEGDEGDKDHPYSSKSGLGIFRPNDDYGAVRVADYFNDAVREWNDKHPQSSPKVLNGWYFTGLLDVGGNYMANGKGEIASTYLVAT